MGARAFFWRCQKHFLFLFNLLTTTLYIRTWTFIRRNTISICVLTKSQANCFISYLRQPCQLFASPLSNRGTWGSEGISHTDRRRQSWDLNRGLWPGCPEIFLDCGGQVSKTQGPFPFWAALPALPQACLRSQVVPLNDTWHLTAVPCLRCFQKLKEGTFLSFPQIEIYSDFSKGQNVPGLF